MSTTYMRLFNLFALLSLLCLPSVLNAQQAYSLSPIVQDLAAKNGVSKKLGVSTDSPLYRDTVTAIDLIAKERAAVLDRKNRLETEDYEAAGWMLCVMPWTPPKKETDREELKKLRPKLVDGVSTDENKRARLIRLIDRDRLALSADEIKEQRLRPSDFFNTKMLTYK